MKIRALNSEKEFQTLQELENSIRDIETYVKQSFHSFVDKTIETSKKELDFTFWRKGNNYFIDFEPIQIDVRTFRIRVENSNVIISEVLKSSSINNMFLDFLDREKE